jgi:DNA-binding transcriptional ArsR family regulator
VAHFAPSEEFLGLVATKFRMLSDPTRLAILNCLMHQGELNVGQIVEVTRGGLANVSKHLKLLANAKIVSRRKQGSFVLYRFDDPVLKKVCELVCDSLRRELEGEVRRNKQLLKKRG